ncbi:MAG: helix-turn-helix transcriptional regulator [Prolixibacteraceae bacterium]|nr:helix-turn-helix transcriptional regulator [Prolixibacteraceae bacterium]
MKLLKTISDKITVLEAERDFGDITPDGEELLAVLNLCYDLLCRTQIAQKMVVPQPDEMKEPGFEDDFIQQYGVCSNQLADFAFSIATRQGKINMRNLLYQIMFDFKQKDIAKNIGIRPNTISDYMNGHKSMTVKNYEKIINTIHEKLK